jgi:hypothetical protein
MLPRDVSPSSDHLREAGSSYQYDPSNDILRQTSTERASVTYIHARAGDFDVVAMSPREQRPVVSVRQEDNWLSNQGLHPERYDFPTFDYNCHGWTFLKGAGWIDNIDNAVDKIVRQGNFARIDPANVQQGDIVFYRDTRTGSVLHSGIVEKDTAYISSKWDSGSLFIHRIDEVPQRYQGPVEYYRPPQGWQGLAIVSQYKLSSQSV